MGDRKVKRQSIQSIHALVWAWRGEGLRAKDATGGRGWSVGGREGGMGRGKMWILMGYQIMVNRIRRISWMY